jgi:hypothetical protein
LELAEARIKIGEMFPFGDFLVDVAFACQGGNFLA